MSDLAIRVDNISKEYRIGGLQQNRTFRESLTDVLSSPFRRGRDILRGQAYGAAGLTETIWALKDVSFDVHHGDVIGVIGRNGAGKSTLLKVLSRITEPSAGVVEMYGRVGALLEVGTGFHLELTGRENIYLNGAILGMMRDEITQKFDEIVAFSGVERFIDTPVKHYSSGMRLRLGFSVAAHLEPEILVVDEVLAVGDAEFQKKCLGKMESVAGEGRTVLFVSHNLSAVKQLCQRGILLDQGRVVADDLVGPIIHTYQKMLQETSLREGGDDVQFVNMTLNGAVQAPVDFTASVDVDLVIGVAKPIDSYRLYGFIEDPEGQSVVVLKTDHHENPQLQTPGQYHLHLSLPALWLSPGVYSLYFKLLPVGVGLSKRYLSDRVVIDGINPAAPLGLSIGTLNPPNNWEISPAAVEQPAPER